MPVSACDLAPAHSKSTCAVGRRQEHLPRTNCYSYGQALLRSTYIKQHVRAVRGHTAVTRPFGLLHIEVWMMLEPALPFLCLATAILRVTEYPDIARRLHLLDAVLAALCGVFLRWCNCMGGALANHCGLSGTQSVPECVHMWTDAGVW